MNFLLDLRFRARHRDPSLVEMAEVISDIEALYHAAQRATREEGDLLPVFIAQRNAQRAQRSGLSDDLLGEIERGTRAIVALEREGAGLDTIGPLRDAMSFLARQQAEAIYLASPPDRSLRLPDIPLHVRRLSMASPLKVLTSIPPEYWTGGGVALFLTAVERKFNFVKRIRTERVKLTALQAKARAETSEAELLDAEAQRALRQLRARDVVVFQSRLNGIEGQQSLFQLEKGVLVPEDPHRPGHPLRGGLPRGD